MIQFIVRCGWGCGPMSCLRQVKDDDIRSAWKSYSSAKGEHVISAGIKGITYSHFDVPNQTTLIVAPGCPVLLDLLDWWYSLGRPPWERLFPRNGDDKSWLTRGIQSLPRAFSSKCLLAHQPPKSFHYVILVQQEKDRYCHWKHPEADGQLNVVGWVESKVGLWTRQAAKITSAKCLQNNRKPLVGMKAQDGMACSGGWLSVDE